MTADTVASIAEEETLTLTENQQEALAELLEFIVQEDRKYFVLRGFSGTGKTTLISHLIDNIGPYIKMLKVSNPKLQEPAMFLTATTNKAAQVLEEKTHTEVTTIHSLLHLALRTDYKTGKEILSCRVRYGDTQMELQNSIILMDEASMASRELLRHLEKSLHKTTKVIMIGDPFQLAPVNESFSRAFASGHKEFSLAKVQRQQEGNSILLFGDQIRETIQTGVFKPIPFDGKNLVYLDGPEFQELIDDHFSDMNHAENNKILAWKNQRVIEYNDYVRKFFTNDPMPQPGEFWVANSPVIRGDRVTIANNEQIQIKSAQSIGGEQRYTYPGDRIPYYEVIDVKGRMIAMPQDINLYKATLKKLSSECRKSKNWKEFFDFKEFYGDIRPSYALTVHKSQGSTFDNVYVDLYDIGQCNKPDDVARMLYVAITRARNKAYFYGKLPPKYSGG